MTYGTTHRIQRPSNRDADIVHGFKVRFNPSENSWQVWTFMAPRIDNYKWFNVTKSIADWYQKEFHVPVIEYVQEHNFPAKRSHGDYLISALESELTILPNDSKELVIKKQALKILVNAYMAMPEGMTTEDALMMEKIDQAVISVHEQRMSDSLGKASD